MKTENIAYALIALALVAVSIWYGLAMTEIEPMLKQICADHGGNYTELICTSYQANPRLELPYLKSGRFCVIDGVAYSQFTGTFTNEFRLRDDCVTKLEVSKWIKK